MSKITTKEKVEDICLKFSPDGFIFDTETKSALIVVDEVLSVLYEYHYDSESGAYEFYSEVKKELEKRLFLIETT